MAPIKAKAYEGRMFPMRAYTASRRTTGVSTAKTMVTVRRTRKKSCKPGVQDDRGPGIQKAGHVIGPRASSCRLIVSYIP
jgi:hypothetical protein